MNGHNGTYPLVQKLRKAGAESHDMNVSPNNILQAGEFIQ